METELLNPSLGADRIAPEFIDRIVQDSGLVCLGIVGTRLDGESERLELWLSEGRQASMDWLGDHLPLRRDPERLLPGTRSIICVALPYYQGDRLDAAPVVPRVAQYARFYDYHKILWRRGEAAAAVVAARWGGSFRVLSDSAPVLERALAARTEQGFIGKNTCFIHPELGSFLLLGEILTTLEIRPDNKAPVSPGGRSKEGGCGSCDLCQVHCPTGALDSDYRIDAGRCLAYWTIENAGSIPEVYWPHLATYYFGCDLCQLACPYNWRARGNRLPSDVALRPLPSLFSVATMSVSEYESWFHGTPMVRAKRNGLRRNALIALTVTEDKRLDEALKIARLDAPSPISETLLQIDRYRLAKRGLSR